MCVYVCLCICIYILLFYEYLPLLYRHKQRSLATIGLCLAACIGAVALAVALFVRCQNSSISSVPLRTHNQKVKIGKSRLTSLHGLL